MPETMREWAQSVRDARGNLIVIPAMPVRNEVLADAYAKLCTNCMFAPESPRVFVDAADCIWCEPCATSDVIGAAFTREELTELFGKLCEWEQRFSQAAAGPIGTRESVALEAAGAELLGLIGELPAAWFDGRPAAPNPFGLAYP